MSIIQKKQISDSVIWSFLPPNAFFGARRVCKNFLDAEKVKTIELLSGEIFAFLSSHETRLNFTLDPRKCCYYTPQKPLAIKVLKKGEWEKRLIDRGTVFFTSLFALSPEHPFLNNENIHTVVIMDITGVEKFRQKLGLFQMMPNGRAFYVSLQNAPQLRNLYGCEFVPLEDFDAEAKIDIEGMNRRMKPDDFIRLPDNIYLQSIFNERELKYHIKRKNKIPPTFSIVSELDQLLLNRPSEAWSLLRRLYLEKCAFTSLSDETFEEALCKILKTMKLEGRSFFKHDGVSFVFDFTYAGHSKDGDIVFDPPIMEDPYPIFERMQTIARSIFPRESDALPFASSARVDSLVEDEAIKEDMDIALMVLRSFEVEIPPIDFP